MVTSTLKQQEKRQQLQDKIKACQARFKQLRPAGEAKRKLQVELDYWTEELRRLNEPA